MPNEGKLHEFAAWVKQHITDDEEGQAQIFSDSQPSEFSPELLIFY